MPESQSTTVITGQSNTATASGKSRRILVTGATGTIGAYFAEHAHEQYTLRLLVHRSGPRADALDAFGEVVVGDLTDLERLKTLCEGVDTVLHLAGVTDPSATWDSLLPVNVIGTYNVMAAARSAGCRRVVFASSIHAVSGYPPDVQVKAHEPVNPGDLYGVTKCFGEALGRYMAAQEGLSVIAVRIGAFEPPEVEQQERGSRLLDAYVSQRDLQQLLERCIEVPQVHFAILHGLSDNRFKRLDISEARTLVGYDPQDDMTRTHPRLRELQLGESVRAHNLADDEEQDSGMRKDVP